MADVKRWSCKLLLRRIGATDYEDAGFLNATRVPQPGEPFDVRGTSLEIVHARVTHVHAPPPEQAGEFTIHL
jgi:hypothetical protein